LLLSAVPQVTAAANAILLQTGDILIKPINVAALLGVIEERLRVGAPPSRVPDAMRTRADARLFDDVAHDPS
jgi:hypothetical protein